jgi:hypothetical protein
MLPVKDRSVWHRRPLETMAAPLSARPARVLPALARRFGQTTALDAGGLCKGVQMAEHGICDQCNDPKNFVTAHIGGTLSTTRRRRHMWVADIHTDRNDAWHRGNASVLTGGTES